ncbi:hypothetical protein QBC47DRAFT_464549 [Echria macrotheca]|uniref:Uncharacterized protein n=1 Tax=Echria macrotheca TaxID=438768 RepID=A0AAJ0B3D8_9PEZI|nr:hypothetical protein QBC47DRAFT_464549 [Echria macrotheca]
MAGRRSVHRGPSALSIVATAGSLVAASTELVSSGAVPSERAGLGPLLGRVCGADVLGDGLLSPWLRGTDRMIWDFVQFAALAGLSPFHWQASPITNVPNKRSSRRYDRHRPSKIRPRTPVDSDEQEQGERSGSHHRDEESQMSSDGEHRDRDEDEHEDTDYDLDEDGDEDEYEHSDHDRDEDGHEPQPNRGPGRPRKNTPPLARAPQDNAPTPGKRGRGRPRKNPSPSAGEGGTVPPPDGQPTPAKRGRGRPRKNPTVPPPDGQPAPAKRGRGRPRLSQPRESGRPQDAVKCRPGRPRLSSFMAGDPPNPGSSSSSSTSSDESEHDPADMPQETPESISGYWDPCATDQWIFEPCTMHTPLWNETLQRQVADSWTDEDEVCLVQHTSMLRAAGEQDLWKEFGQHFKLPLWELFRYGLRIDTSASDPPCPYMDAELCSNLRIAICHGFWDGDPSILRFALQWAVSAATESKPRAVTPFYPIDREVSAEMQLGDMNRMVHELDSRQHPLRRKRHLQQLCDLIQAETDGPGDNPPGACFLLTAEHVGTLIKALDRLQHPSFHLKARAYARETRHAMRPKHAQYHPRSEASLRSWKKRWILDERKRFAIAYRFYCNNISADDGYQPIDVSQHDVPVLPPTFWDDGKRPSYAVFEWTWAKSALNTAPVLIALSRNVALGIRLETLGTTAKVILSTGLGPTREGMGLNCCDVASYAALISLRSRPANLIQSLGF